MTYAHSTSCVSSASQEETLNQQAFGDWPCSTLLKGACPASTTRATALLVLNPSPPRKERMPSTCVCAEHPSKHLHRHRWGGSFTFLPWVQTRADQTGPEPNEAQPVTQRGHQRLHSASLSITQPSPSIQLRLLFSGFSRTSCSSSTSNTIAHIPNCSVPSFRSCHKHNKRHRSKKRFTHTRKS